MMSSGPRTVSRERLALDALAGAAARATGRHESYVERLEALACVQRALERAVAETAAEASVSGLSWRTIGRAMGVSGQSAHAAHAAHARQLRAERAD